MSHKLFYRNQYLMHSRFELYIPTKESEKLDLLFEEIVNKIEQLENSISKFIDSSETSLLNKNAAFNPVEVSESYFSLMEDCSDYYIKTDGFFDITAGSVHQAKGNGIKLDKANRSVIFESSYISIDFGAIGKGLALKQALEILKNEVIENALIVFGDSSVYALGSHPLGEFWPVKISNGENTRTIKLKNNGLSSSGLHLSNEELIPHIVNPFTGKMLDKNEKVIVVSDCPVRAEVLSTAIYAADELSRKKIKHEFVKEEVFIL